MRLVDADNIVKIAEHAYYEWNLAMAAADSAREINKAFKKQELYKDVKNIVERAETVDAVPVVRCKDCELFGQKCDLDFREINYSGEREINYYGEAERILKCVQRWHDEHPLKTYAQDFREKFPNCAWRNDENAPKNICRYSVHGGTPQCLGKKKCSECWNETIPEEYM